VPSLPDPGSDFAGYRLERPVARGGMGVVYLATHLRLSRQVALKLLAPELAEDADFRERFLTEAHMAAALEHPNVVPVYDAGEEQGFLFLAMRYLPGGDLRELLQREGRLSLERTLRIVEQVASALDAAHELGLVHRDVKPANILFSERHEIAYLSDFGVAKRQSSKGLTRTGSFLGSIDYCAPEQIESALVDGKADVYSLGGVLYHCLTGQPPYVRESEVAVLTAHLRDPPPSLSSVRPDLPAAVDVVLATAMDKQPQARYATSGAFAQALVEGLREPRAQETRAVPDPASAAAGELDFRILGPLEVIVEGRPLQLGGQRQRALLAILLLEAGRVVATDRLVDLLWGEEAPKTATNSLQNAISRLRKELGPEVLRTKAPGYVLGVAPGQIDARRFELQLRDARRAEPEQRRELLQRALDLWRGPALADFAFEQFAQAETRRLEELRLVAREERIEAELELGRHGDVVGELEALVGEHPLRETLRRQLMIALYRSGRQAEALDVYQDARNRFVEELGIEPGPELKQLQTEILRHEAGIAAPGAARAETDDDAEILNALLAGRVVPVLGVDGASDLAAHLASAFSVPDDRPVDLARVSQYIATMKGSGPLYDELHARFEAAVEPGPMHRFLAQLPALLRDRAAPHQLIVSTNYDLALERAFEDAGEELDIVAYVAAGPHRGRFWHRPPGEAPRPIDVPNTYATELSLERRTILLKLHGAVDPLPEREWESFVITEDDYIDYLGRSELTAVVPVALAAKLRRSHFLFLGYEMADWNLRLILNRIWGERPVAYRSWAVQRSPSPLARAFWSRYDVTPLDVEPEAYVELLERRLETV
jgi:DNA-binding SARP family transcriptional activator/predicted Ser/Thr protein kinase